MNTFYFTINDRAEVPLERGSVAGENGKTGRGENGQGTIAFGLVFPSSRFPIVVSNRVETDGDSCNSPLPRSATFMSHQREATRRTQEIPARSTKERRSGLKPAHHAPGGPNA